MIYISHTLLVFIVSSYLSSAEKSGKLYTNYDRESRKWANEQLREYKPIFDDTFKPKAFDAYMEMKREKLARFGGCSGYRCGNVKQLIKDGKLLNNHFFRSKKAIPILPLMPSRLRRSTDLKLKDEIDSIRIYPIQSNGTKAIECRKDSDEEITCKQDDFEYKIKLKHKDLSQESLESLIRSLYLRLSASVPTDKRKRSEILTAPPPSMDNDDNEAPFMIVLPTPESTAISGCPVKSDDVTEWPYKVCKTCEEEEADTNVPPIDHMIIECSPRDYDSINPNEPRALLDELNPSTKRPSAYIYSCRWQGKRQVESQNIVVPMKKSKESSRPARQSFKIIIDPSEASTNMLPISITV